MGKSSNNASRSWWSGRQRQTKTLAHSFSCASCQVHGLSFGRFPRPCKTVGPISGPFNICGQLLEARGEHNAPLTQVWSCLFALQATRCSLSLSLSSSSQPVAVHSLLTVRKSTPTVAREHRASHPSSGVRRKLTTPARASPHPLLALLVRRRRWRLLTLLHLPALQRFMPFVPKPLLLPLT